MNKSALIGGIISLNIIAMFVAITHKDLFDIACYALNVMGILVYYVDTR